MKNFEGLLYNSECLLPLTKNEAVVRVYKKRRILEININDKVEYIFKISLGRNPEGRKCIEGDGRTPEGKYYICTKNDKSKYKLFLGISYPGKEDAKMGLLNGIIDELTYCRIVEAIENNIRPPWDTLLGGAIGIHCGGTCGDWTQGCIALDDMDMEKLWKYAEIGTTVEIYK